MDDTTHACSHCHIGTLHGGVATYAAWHGGEFVVVPSMPVRVCDVCGERTYDPYALEQLALLIGTATRLPSSGTTGAQRSPDWGAPVDVLRTRRRA
ncbi:MAG TPA: YgiT-type zinc finger protein [Anaerolineae bacterium]